MTEQQYILVGNEFERYFQNSADAETMEEFHNGTIKAVAVEIDIEDQRAQCALFEEYPTPERVGAANVWLFEPFYDALEGLERAGYDPIGGEA